MTTIPLHKLQQIRKTIEDESDGLSDEQAFLLFDVCIALELTRTETEYVLGKHIMAFVNAPPAFTNNGKLGPVGAPAPTTENPKCMYCEHQALAPGYTTPPLCEKHVVIHVIVQYLKRHNQPVTVETVTQFIVQQSQIDIELHEIAALLEPMEVDYAA